MIGRRDRQHGVAVKLLIVERIVFTAKHHLLCFCFEPDGPIIRLWHAPAVLADAGSDLSERPLAHSDGEGEGEGIFIFCTSESPSRQIEKKHLRVLARADVENVFIADRSDVAGIERCAFKSDCAARHLQPSPPSRL